MGSDRLGPFRVGDGGARYFEVDGSGNVALHSIAVGGPVVSATAPTYNEIIVDPNGFLGAYSTLQIAINYAAALSTAANPWTIRLLPGVYSSPTSITVPANTVGLNIVGPGSDAVIIRPTAAWYSSLVASANFLDLGNLEMGTLAGFTVDTQTNDPLTSPYNTTIAISAIGWSANSAAPKKQLVVKDVHIMGTASGWNTYTASSTGAPPTLFFSNCLIESRSIGYEAGNESLIANSTTVLAFNDTTAYWGTQSQPSGSGSDGIASKRVNAISLGTTGSGWTQAWQGGYLLAYDNRSGTAGGSVSVLRVAQGASNSLAQFDGLKFLSTQHCTQPDDGAGSENHTAGIVIPGGTTVLGRIAATGCEFSQEVATNSKGYFMGSTVVVDSTTASGLTIDIAGGHSELSAGSLSKTAANGVQGRLGDVVYTQISGTPPTINFVGHQLKQGFTAPIAVSTIQDFRPRKVTGTFASANNVIVMLATTPVTLGSTAFFTNGSAAVSAGTGFTTNLIPGDFIRASPDANSALVRIKSIESASALTLAANYVGTGGTQTVFASAANQNTQPDTSYGVAITGNVNETFWVTAKTATSFTVNSSNATSTATVDCVVTR